MDAPEVVKNFTGQKNSLGKGRVLRKHDSAMAAIKRKEAQINLRFLFTANPKMA